MAKTNRVRGLVELLEATESWTVDETESVKSLLVSLSNAHKAPELAAWAEKNPKKTLIAIGLVKVGVGFEILRGLESQNKGLEAKLVALSAQHKDDPTLKLLASRIEVIDRSNLLIEIFTPERLARVNAAMREAASV